MFAEEWRPVVGYEGRYEVSNRGRLRGPHWGVVKARNNRGYRAVTLVDSPHGGRKTYSVHRLVMAAFVGPCPVDKQVNHIDGNKSNNYIENLEYVTQTENVRHALALSGGKRAQRLPLCPVCGEWCIARREAGVYQALCPRCDWRPEHQYVPRNLRESRAEYNYGSRSDWVTASAEQRVALQRR